VVEIIPTGLQKVLKENEKKRIKWRKKMNNDKNKEKKKEPVVFGVVCPHCYKGGQVPGMKCLNCGKKVPEK